MIVWLVVWPGLIAAQDNPNVWGVPVTQGATPGYVPDQICAQCHGDLADSFAKVGMGRSFYAPDADYVIEDFTTGYHHVPSGRHYQMELRGEEYWFTRHRIAPDGTPVDRFEIKVDWIIGSGNHSRIYVYRSPNGLLSQLPLAWYSQDATWAMAPGFEFEDHLGVQRVVRRRCMVCHNAYPELPKGADAHGMPEVFPVDLPQGIGCQRCHGPGAAHVDLALGREVMGQDGALDALRAAITGPGDLSQDQQRDVCYSCHLQPAVAVPSMLRHGRGVFEFEPGQDLADHIVQIDIVDQLRASGDRFEINHHPYRMEQSACFVQSEGALGCLTCHDPHAKVPASERAAHYKAACMSCHESDDAGLPVMASGAPHPDLAADADCTTCHMPNRRTQDVINVWMTDHKIQAGPVPDDLLRPIAKEPPIVAEVLLRDPDLEFAPGEGILHQTMAILAHDPTADYAANALARSLFDRQITAFEPWVELAQSRLSSGDVNGALLAADRAEALSPGHPKAVKLQGLALARLGRIEDAQERVEATLASHPVMAEQHVNLALLKAYLGDIDAGIAELQQAIAKQPTLWQIWRTLGDLERERGDDAAAADAYQRALQIEPTAARARDGLVAALDALGRGVEADRHRAMLNP